ncbi:MAG: hypothetical protein ACLSDQ_13765 [Adlercreutzia equolifaciens]
MHALNAIAYYLRANDMDTSDVLEDSTAHRQDSPPCSRASGAAARTDTISRAIAAIGQ